MGNNTHSSTNGMGPAQAHDGTGDDQNADLDDSGGARRRWDDRTFPINSRGCRGGVRQITTNASTSINSSARP